MKVAIYNRVSTVDQNNLNQELRLVEYAKKNKWTYDIFNEVESTRKTRPIKAHVLNLLRKREYDAVLVFKFDRWARSTLELVSVMQELTNKGIGFISFYENLDLTTPTGKMHFTIIAAFAEFERDMIRVRTMEGLDRARSEGKKLGRPFKTKQSPPVHDILGNVILGEK
jgi:DNA invertase Pin-like site-specific DNA recombinase